MGERSVTAWAVSLSILAVIPAGTQATAVPGISLASFPQGTDVAINLSSDGRMNTIGRALIANGSLLRFAIDGNFSPLLNALPLNDSTRNSIAQAIYQAEDGQFASLFGNHDGQVETGEVDSFQSLLMSDSGVLPVWLILGGAAPTITIDGQAPAAQQLTQLRIAGAVGADTSSAPISLAARQADDYALAGTSHLVAVGWSLFSAPTVLGAPHPLNLTLRLPDGTSVESTSGFLSVSSQSDPWGLGASSVSGSAQPSSAAPVTIRFAPAFPWATVAITAALVGGVAALLVVWVVRRRSRKARATDGG